MTLPTFTPAGWITNPLEIIDFLMAHFFLTQKSQTRFHRQAIASYQALLADAPSNGQLQSNIETKLGDMIKSQFDNVKIGCAIKPIDGNPDNIQQVIEIQCSFDYQGITYALGHGIELLGTQVKRVFRLNETGALT